MRRLAGLPLWSAGPSIGDKPDPAVKESGEELWDAGMPYAPARGSEILDMPGEPDLDNPQLFHAILAASGVMPEQGQGPRSPSLKYLAFGAILVALAGVRALAEPARECHVLGSQTGEECNFDSYSPDRKRKLAAVVKPEIRIHPHCRSTKTKAVVARVLVRNDGIPICTCVLQGDRLCSVTVPAAIEQWRFKPWSADSKTPTYAIYKVTFRIAPHAAP